MENKLVNSFIGLCIHKLCHVQHFCVTRLRILQRKQTQAFVANYKIMLLFSLYLNNIYLLKI